MGRLQTFKKQILDYLESLKNRIAETNTFNSLKERYQSFSRARQKTIITASLSFFIFIAFALPFYYFYLSVQTWNEFDSKWQASLKILKYRSYNSEALNQTDSQIRYALSTVITKYQDSDYNIQNKKIFIKDKNIRQMDYSIEVKHLNVRQVMQVGAEIQNIPNAYMLSLTMKQSPDYPKHYDSTFVLSVYSPKNKFSSKPDAIDTGFKSRKLRKKSKPSSTFRETERDFQQKKQRGIKQLNTRDRKNKGGSFLNNKSRGGSTLTDEEKKQKLKNMRKSINKTKKPIKTLRLPKEDGI